MINSSIVCSNSVPKLYCFIYSKILFYQIVPETLFIPMNIVLPVDKAMYQDDFLPLNFALFWHAVIPARNN